MDGTITRTNTQVTKASFTMDIAGANPYYCEYHYNGGMYGVIYVGDACSSAPKAPIAAPTGSPAAVPVANPNSQTPSSATPKTSAGKLRRFFDSTTTSSQLLTGSPFVSILLIF